MNPYTVLGIKKDATDAEVKKAYRTLSKLHHPDVGGDERKFQALNLAYRVLSDPKKRKLYDENGIIMDDSPNHLANLINARLVDIAEKWLDNMLKGGKVPLSQFALGGFDEGKRQLAAANLGLEDMARKVDNVLERLSCSTGESVIHGVIKQRKATYKKGIEQNKNEIVVLDQLREVILTYSYEEEVEEMIITNTSTTTINFGTTGFRF